MKFPRKAKKKKGSRQEAEKPTTLRDHFVIFGTIGGIILVVLLGVHLISTRQQLASIENHVSGWKHDFQLSDEQAETLRTMELEFHGSGDPFFRPARSYEETRSHHHMMVEVVSPEFRDRFLHNLTKQ